MAVLMAFLHQLLAVGFSQQREYTPEAEASGYGNDDAVLGSVTSCGLQPAAEIYARR
jgi:hypothetical protein